MDEAQRKIAIKFGTGTTSDEALAKYLLNMVRSPKITFNQAKVLVEAAARLDNGKTYIEWVKYHYPELIETKSEEEFSDV